MRQKVQPHTAAWLILLLQTLRISCSNIDTSIGSDGMQFDPDQLQFLGGYLKLPVHLQAPSPGNISEECQDKLYQLLNVTSSQFKDESIALDAFGKPGAGIKEGNAVWLGSYDECVNLEEFNYCLAIMDADIKGKSTPVLIKWGVCAPAICSGEDVENALNDMLAFLLGDVSATVSIKAAAVTCATNPPIPYSAGFYFTVILLVLIGLLMIGGALYAEYLKFVARQIPDSILQTKQEDDVPLLGTETNHKINYSMEVPQGIFGRFLLCFAFTLNLSKLLDTRQKDSSIGSLNGIRFISMTWVILGHTLLFVIIYATEENPLTILNWLQEDFGFEAVANAFFAVDTFFVLSGCLVSYLTLSRMEELKSVKAWLWFYFHRYWRLTPVLVFTILIFMYIQPFFGDAPIWQATTTKPFCHKYWWTNLLYINNFYPTAFAEECLGWSWYLANDMQFFIVSPLLLVPLYHAPILGWIILCAGTIISMVTTGVILGVYDLSVSFLEQFPTFRSTTGQDFSSLIYVKPYCRIAPYLVGIGLGFIMHRIGKRKVKVQPLIAATGWVLAVGMGVSVVYGLYPSYHSSQDLNRASSIAYAAMSRFAWGIALAWVVFACKYGYGGWINSFLSWTGWVPLSRLTYCAYMFHPIVLMTFIPNFKNGIYMSKYLLAYYFVGSVTMSYFVAIVVAIAVEYPFANLEKLLMPNNPREKHERNSQSQESSLESKEA